MNRRGATGNPLHSTCCAPLALAPRDLGIICLSSLLTLSGSLIIPGTVWRLNVATGNVQNVRPQGKPASANRRVFCLGLASQRPAGAESA